MTSKMKNTLWEQGVSGTFSSTKSILNYNSFDIESQFRQAMQSAGIDFSGELVADGRIHRFSTNRNKKDKAGWYILHIDNIPAGCFGDWRTNFSRNWWITRQGNRPISHALNKQIKEAKQQYEAEVRQKREAAAKKANTIWNKSTLITQPDHHPYLIKKQIQPHYTKVNRNSLVIPLKDESKRIVNLQFISPEGEKRFLSDGKKKGCFCPIGQPTPIILITEGFATGASLHEETGQCVIVAFDAGNLEPVAQVIRKMFPTSEIIICGDNDLSGLGQTKARHAALSIRGKVLIPKFPGKDWNDVLTGCNHD